MKSNYWQKSMCRGGYLHRYEILQQFSDGVVEVCEICGDRKFFKMIAGQTDNLRYISYHLRQALPMNHNQFKKEYADV